jgi:hypothetical protein
MSCVSAAELVKAELGELTLNQVHTVDAHIATCSHCSRVRAELRELVADLGRLPPAPQADLFVAQVMAARSTPARTPRHRMHIPMFAFAATLLLVGGSAIFTSGHRRTEETWSARGPKAPASPRSDASSEVLIVRKGKLLPLAGQTLSATDAFAVRYVNPTDQTRHLVAFVVDAAGAVHWIFPEYADAATDPRSIPLAPTKDERLLPQIVAPDQPAPGPMRVLTLISQKPTSVKTIEGALRNAHAGGSTKQALARFYPGALIREWSCSWAAR